MRKSPTLFQGTAFLSSSSLLEAVILELYYGPWSVKYLFTDHTHMSYLRVTGRQLMHQGAQITFLQQCNLFCKHMACVQY